MADIQGRFNDGRTAASRAVTVRHTPKGYEIRDSNQLLVAFWHHDDVCACDDLPGGNVRLCCRKDPDARLTLPKAAAGRPAARKPRTGLRMSAALAASAALVAAAIALLPMAGRIAAAAVPLSVEQRWGDNMVRGFEQSVRLCHGPAGEAALRLLTERLDAPLPPERRPRHIEVADIAAVNAISLPGGTIVVFRGLLAQAADADEVAGVLAHEMTHVAERHPLAGALRGLGIAGLITLVSGDASGVLAGGAGALMAGAYSRDDEAEADRGALRLLGAAGIGSHSFAEFFRHTQTGIPAWLTDHPDSLARADFIDAHATPSHAPALTAGQWGALKGICVTKPTEGA